mgnify:CR=1 FL=1
MEKKVILSGIQATGDLHLGHYIGVLKNFVKISLHSVSRIPF